MRPGYAVTRLSRVLFRYDPFLTSTRRYSPILTVVCVLGLAGPGPDTTGTEEDRAFFPLAARGAVGVPHALETVPRSSAPTLAIDLDDRIRLARHD